MGQRNKFKRPRLNQLLLMLTFISLRSTSSTPYRVTSKSLYHPIPPNLICFQSFHHHKVAYKNVKKGINQLTYSTSKRMGLPNDISTYIPRSCSNIPFKTRKNKVFKRFNIIKEEKTSFDNCRAFATTSQLFQNPSETNIDTLISPDEMSKKTRIESELRLNNSSSQKDEGQWKGVSRSTSPFVTHFIAQDTKDPDDGINYNVTVKEAVTSIIPKNHPSENTFLENEQVENESMKLLKTQPIPDPRLIPFDRQLTALELLALGSVWFLPASAPKDPSMGTKPVRLNISSANQTLDIGDYLRVHHSPRRFPELQNYDWRKKINLLQDETFIESTGSTDKLKQFEGVIVAEDADMGYIVINKPAGVPVHSTVDNELENVSSEISRVLLERKDRRNNNSQKNAAHTEGFDSETQNRTQRYATSFTQTNYRKKQSKHKQKPDPLIYVTTPQRLDQNTSGLFVVSTKKTFAAYFAKLLSHKTQYQLLNNNNAENAICADEKANYLMKKNEQVKIMEKKTESTRKDIEKSRTGSGIHKRYKCLVCIFSSEIMTVNDQVSHLRDYVSSGSIMRHFLEPSIKAPKRFVSQIPQQPFDASISGATWAESLLRIVNISEVYSIEGHEKSEGRKLALALWGNKATIPENCKGVVELQIELLTGRTHQIRGQLCAEGFPLVGDAMYGGAIPQSIYIPHPSDKTDDASSKKRFVDSEMLALQCCELSFLDPVLKVREKRNRRESMFLPPLSGAEKWNKFRLKDAWWTPFLHIYGKEIDL